MHFSLYLNTSKSADFTCSALLSAQHHLEAPTELSELRPPGGPGDTAPGEWTAVTAHSGPGDTAPGKWTAVTAHSAVRWINEFIPMRPHRYKIHEADISLRPLHYIT